MTNYWYIENDFDSARKKRIGASEISMLIPNPERPSESLAGYDQTAITLWRQKTGRDAKDNSNNLFCEMGHWNEVKAIELFLRGIDPSMARQYREGRLRFELDAERDPTTSPRGYQETPLRHSTQWYNDQFIVHPDGIWDAPLISPIAKYQEHNYVDAHGYSIDLARCFLVEAKTASYWAAKRRAGSLVSGYDFDLKTWQGIPLRHYVQIQFQLACLDVEVAYLPLLYDSASFHVWEIRRDRKVGDQLIDLAGRMAWHIQHDEPPKELAMNALDVAALYPSLSDDFAFTSDPEEREALLAAARASTRAAAQEKAWKAKKEDANDALAVLLRDRREIRIELDGEVVPVVKWIEKKGGERIIGLKEAKAVPGAEEKLREMGLVKQGEPSRYVSVCLREEEVEE